MKIDCVAEEQELKMLAKCAEGMLETHRGNIGSREVATFADNTLYDLLRHLVNVVKRMSGDHSPLIQQ
jgi:hypothetical protein